MTTGACDSCLRRSALIARLAGRIEILRREKRYVRDVLALPDDELVAAVAGGIDAPQLPDTAAVLREALARTALSAACQHDPCYPQSLRDDPSAPAVVYLAGRPDRLTGLLGPDGCAPAVAIVGTRRASGDGLIFARDLGRQLSAAGVTVVSGMALGIDGASHDGALAAGARTIAVLAGSADRPYPRRRSATHSELIERAAVISEMPPDAPVFAWNFLARNRIIAGLAQMTVVVEAAERSGSLVTAEMALDLGREVGAVPGTPLNWRAAGTNELIRDGATIVRSAEDVLERLAERAVVPLAADLRVEPLPERLCELVAAIDSGLDTVSALATAGHDPGTVQAAVTELELLGAVHRVPGGRIVCAQQASERL